MIFSAGDIIAFSHLTEPKQGVRDVKSMRQRTQSGATTWKEKKPVVDTHEKYPQCLVLHANWAGSVHCLLMNNYSQQEINYLTAIIDPFFAEEIIKKDGRIRAELQRIPRDANILSPHDFYIRVIKPFIGLYDGYRLYKPHKMLNIKVVKRYSDIQQRLKAAGKEPQKQQAGKIDITPQHSSFFDRYVQSISRLRGPRMK